jgi:hypothetical protein
MIISSVCVCVWYLQSKEILLNLSMKRWNSAFNAQRLRVIIVVVQVGVVSQIYVAASKQAVEAPRRRQDETLFTTKIDGKSWFASQLFSFVKIFISSYTFWWPIIMPKLAVLVPVI